VKCQRGQCLRYGVGGSSNGRSLAYARLARSGPRGDLKSSPRYPKSDCPLAACAAPPIPNTPSVWPRRLPGVRPAPTNMGAVSSDRREHLPEEQTRQYPNRISIVEAPLSGH